MKIARFEKISFEEFKNNNLGSKIDYDKLVVPYRGTKFSAGYDFVSPVRVTIKPQEAKIIPTGIKAYMEAGWVLSIYPRSSFGFKYRMMLSNTVGIIDKDYYNNSQNEGHILVKIYNGGTKEIVIEKYDRFVQGIFLQFGLAEENNILEERKGGLGSTNK